MTKLLPIRVEREYVVCSEYVAKSQIQQVSIFLTCVIVDQIQEFQTLSFNHMTINIFVQKIFFIEQDKIVTEY